MIEYFQQYRLFQRNARLYLLSNALSGMTAGIFLVLYNLYLTSLGYHEDFVGATLFVGTLGAGLAIFPAGLIIDRWSGKWVLIVSSALIGLGGLGTILFRQPGPLLFCAFVTGVAAAFTLVINAPFLTRNSEPEERPHLFSLNLALVQITTVLGEVLGGALPAWFLHSRLWTVSLPGSLTWLLAAQAEPRSYQLALLCSGLLSLPSFVPLFLMGNDRPEAVPARAAPAKQMLLWRSWLSTAWERLQPASLSAFALTPFFALVLVQILTGLGAGLLIPYFNLFFVRHLNASPALFGLLDGTANGLTALTTLFAPWLAWRLGRVNSIVLTRLCSLPLMLAIGFAPTLPLAASLYPLREGVMDMSQGVLQVFSMEAVPEHHRGVANSAYQAVYQVAWAVTSSLGGLVIVHAGYGPLFVSTALCYLAAAVLLWGRFRGKGQI
ncbi:MAG TPA: MFS transporter [Ktedonobacteraceae bacterium]|nr:MFS transporter [Ktedonobacteraceae bacterium]